MKLLVIAVVILGTAGLACALEKEALQIEPPRDCRRLHSVRGWGHGDEKAVFGRGTRACGSDGF
jgi:hypothetical protein